MSSSLRRNYLWNSLDCSGIAYYCVNDLALRCAEDFNLINKLSSFVVSFLVSV